MKRQRFKLSVSVFLLLKKNNKILLLKRANTGWMDGFYSIPAGGLDGEETLLNAVIREAEEEVGIAVTPPNIQLVHTMHCFIHGEEWLGQFFITESWEGEPKINEPDKHSAIIWVNLTNLPKDLIPYVKQAIENYSKDIHYSSFKL